MQTPEEGKRTRAVYEEQVAPLLRQAFDICESNGMGFMAYVASSMEELPDGSPLMAVHRYLTATESCTCPHIMLMGAVEEKDVELVRAILTALLLGGLSFTKEHPGAGSEKAAEDLMARLMSEKK